MPGAAERLRAAQDDRRVLQAPRPERADQVPRRGDRRQPGQRARGAEVRQRQPRQLARRSTSAPAAANELAYRDATCRMRKAAQHKAHRRHDEQRDAGRSERRLHRDPRHRSRAARTAGYPQITIPMGYNATQRRDVRRLDPRRRLRRAQPDRRRVRDRAGDEAAPAGLASSTRACTAARRRSRRRRSPRAAAATRTTTASMAMVGTAPTLRFSLETESAKSLQDRMTAGTLTSRDADEGLPGTDRAHQRRGPGDAGRARAQPERDRRGQGARRRARVQRRRAARCTASRCWSTTRSTSTGLATTAGSIALQDSSPAADSKIVAKLKAAGAIILGKTNVSELGGVFDANMPEGYSSLGGQVLLAVRHRQDAGRLLGGLGGGDGDRPGGADRRHGDLDRHRAADRAGGHRGRGRRSSRRSAASAATACCRSRSRRTRRARSPGRCTTRRPSCRRSRAATRRPRDGGRAGSGLPRGLTPTALSGKQVAVIASTTAPYPAVVTALAGLGATTVVTTVGTPSPNPASIVTTRVQARPERLPRRRPGAGAKSLQGIIDYNTANPVEGLKYQQGQLIAAQAIDLADPATSATYEAEQGRGPGVDGRSSTRS